jgi:hypothetical protein
MLTDDFEWGETFEIPPLPIRVEVVGAEDALQVTPPPLRFALESDDEAWRWDVASDDQLVLRGPQEQAWMIVPRGDAEQDYAEHLRPTSSEDDRVWEWVWDEGANLSSGEYTVEIVARQDGVEERVNEITFSIAEPILDVDVAVAEGVTIRDLPPLALTATSEGWTLAVQEEITPVVTTPEGETQTIEVLVDDEPRPGTARYDVDAGVLTWYPDKFTVEPLPPGPHIIAVRIGEDIVASRELEIEAPLVVQYQDGNLRSYPKSRCGNPSVCLEDPEPGTELKVFAKLEDVNFTYLLLRRMDTEELVWALLLTSDLRLDEQQLTADSPEIQTLTSIEMFQIPSFEEVAEMATSSPIATPTPPTTEGGEGE